MTNSHFTRHLTILASVIALGCGSGEPTTPVTPIENLPQPPNPASTHVRAVVWLVEKGLREIPVPPYAASLDPISINDEGEVAGTIVGFNGQPEDAFTWSEAKGLRRAGLAGTNVRVVVTDINASGTVIGLTDDYSGAGFSALVWNPNQGFIPPSRESMVALLSINDLGSIVGSDASGNPVRWDKAAGFSILPRGKEQCTVATSINNNGDILLWFGSDLNDFFGCSPQRWQVLRTNGQTIDVSICCALQLSAMNDRLDAVGRLGGAAVRMHLPIASNGEWEMLGGATPTGINNQGDATVVSDGVPYIWRASGELSQLPLLPGTKTGYPAAINNRGDVVGTMY
jgi:hypothetical protein